MPGLIAEIIVLPMVFEGFRETVIFLGFVVRILARAALKSSFPLRFPLFFHAFGRLPIVSFILHAWPDSRNHCFTNGF